MWLSHTVGCTLTACVGRACSLARYDCLVLLPELRAEAKHAQITISFRVTVPQNAFLAGAQSRAAVEGKALGDVIKLQCKCRMEAAPYLCRHCQRMP